MTSSKFPKRVLSKTSTSCLLGLSCAVFLSACASNSRSENRKFTAQDNLRSGGSITAVHPIGLLFASMDTDGQVGLSKAELKVGTEKQWDVLNAGAKVSAIDYGNWSLSVMGSGNVQPNFLSFDSDFNGGLTKTEFTNGLKREFERADKNTDGIVSREELVYLINIPRNRTGRDEADTEIETPEGVETIPRRPGR